MESLADYLGVDKEGKAASDEPEVVYTAKEFCDKVLASFEFRTYILNHLHLGTLPAAIMIRIMDIGWGKPAERIEHSGEVAVSRVVREVVTPRQLDSRSKTSEKEKVH